MNEDSKFVSSPSSKFILSPRLAKLLLANDGNMEIYGSEYGYNYVTNEEYKYPRETDIDLEDMDTILPYPEGAIAFKNRRFPEELCSFNDVKLLKKALVYDNDDLYETDEEAYLNLEMSQDVEKYKKAVEKHPLDQIYRLAYGVANIIDENFICFLQTKGWDINKASKFYGRNLNFGDSATPLCWTCQEANVEEVKLLLNLGADPNVYTDTFSPLEALIGGHSADLNDYKEIIECLKLLREKGMLLKMRKNEWLLEVFERHKKYWKTIENEEDKEYLNDFVENVCFERTLDPTLL